MHLTRFRHIFCVLLKKIGIMDYLNLKLGTYKCPYCTKPIKCAPLDDAHTIHGIVCESGHFLELIDNRAIAYIDKKIEEIKEVFSNNPNIQQISANAIQQMNGADTGIESTDDVKQMRQSIDHVRSLGDDANNK